MSRRVLEEPAVGDRRWLDALKHRGRLPVVEVATAAARLALDVWEESHPGVAEPRETIEALESWLKEPTESGARAIMRLTHRRGDPDDLDGCWLTLDDGTLPSPAASEAYFAADYAGNCVYASLDFAVEAASAAIGCAKKAGVPKPRLARALRIAAAKVHSVAYDDPGSLVGRAPARGEPRVGKPDRSRPSTPCPMCGGAGFPIGPKETVGGAAHLPHRCDECGRVFDLRT